MSLRIVAAFVGLLAFTTKMGSAKPPELPERPQIEFVVPSAYSRDFFQHEFSHTSANPSSVSPSRDHGPLCVASLVVGGIGIVSRPAR